MPNFLFIVAAVKHPNQWTLIELCVKQELIKGLLELMLAVFCQLFYMVIKNEVLNQF